MNESQPEGGAVKTRVQRLQRRQEGVLRHISGLQQLEKSHTALHGVTPSLESSQRSTDFGRAGGGRVAPDPRQDGLDGSRVDLGQKPGERRRTSTQVERLKGQQRSSEVGYIWVTLATAVQRRGLHHLRLVAASHPQHQSVLIPSAQTSLQLKPGFEPR